MTDGESLQDMVNLLKLVDNLGNIGLQVMILTNRKNKVSVSSTTSYKPKMSRVPATCTYHLKPNYKEALETKVGRSSSSKNNSKSG